MGFYINPRDMSKESWLLRNGEPLTSPNPEFPMTPPDGHHYVCLVNNGGFTAAGICYCPEEVEAFLHPDSRPKYWFVVPDDKLIEVTPSVKDMLS